MELSLNMGIEKQFFQDEFKGILLDILQDALFNSPEGSRRHDILKSILDANESKFEPERERSRVKKELKNLKRFRPEQFGNNFVFVEGKKHYKFDYYGDRRYRITVAKTPSDSRSMINLAQSVIRMIY